MQKKKMACNVAYQIRMRRDHGLEGQFIKRDDHLLWIDIPTEKPYLEEQVKGERVVLMKENCSQLDVFY